MAEILDGDFAAAFETAERCILHGNGLIDCVQKYGQTYLIPRLQEFCRTLDTGRGTIPRVSFWHRVVSSGPFGEPPEFEATAHELAWRFAHRLWLRIHNFLYAEHCLGKCDESNEGPGFAFKKAVILARTKEISELAARATPLDYYKLRPHLRLERDKGLSRFQQELDASREQLANPAIAREALRRELRERLERLSKYDASEWWLMVSPGSGGIDGLWRRLAELGDGYPPRPSIPVAGHTMLATGLSSAEPGIFRDALLKLGIDPANVTNALAAAVQWCGQTTSAMAGTEGSVRNCNGQEWQWRTEIENVSEQIKRLCSVDLPRLSFYATVDGEFPPGMGPAADAEEFALELVPNGEGIIPAGTLFPRPATGFFAVPTNKNRDLGLGAWREFQRLAALAWNAVPAKVKPDEWIGADEFKWMGLVCMTLRAAGTDFVFANEKLGGLKASIGAADASIHAIRLLADDCNATGDSATSDSIPPQIASTNEDRWITVADAARVACVNSGVVSRAVQSGTLRGNGKKGRLRRIDTVDLARWQLDRANSPEQGESAGAIERKLNR